MHPFATCIDPGTGDRGRGGLDWSLLLALALLMTGCGWGQPQPQPRQQEWRPVVQPRVEPERSAPPASTAVPATTPTDRAEPAEPTVSPPTIQLNWETELPPGNAGELIRQGRQRVDQPGGEGSGNRLSCSSCHRLGGTAGGFLSWLGRGNSYPRYLPRLGRTVGLAEQINLCRQHSLGASPWVVNGPEMAAVVAWIEFLRSYPDPVPARELNLPARRADPVAGEVIYQRACRGCHGDGGNGAEAPAAAPPLWGSGSYTEGSDLHRLLVAALFIRDHMPRSEAPQLPLNDEEALDLAAYINSFARPEMPELDRDYPWLSEKPADCPYPPFADPFPADQHKYGPFQAIQAAAEAARAGDWRQYRESLPGYRLRLPMTAQTPQDN